MRRERRDEPVEESWRAHWRATNPEGGVDPLSARHWDRIAPLVGLTNPAVAARLTTGARRIASELGISYRVYDDARTGPAWSFDPVPLVFDREGWRPIVEGVAQRARLLEATLADLLGRRRLLTERLLPPSMILGNPAFHRAVVGPRRTGARVLQMVAVDLLLGRDGVWRIKSDRTQSPSGIGYALADREISIRLFGDALAELGVRPIAPAFERFARSLAQQAGVDDPTMVVLTPGPFNETYAEHAHIARQLGCRLVRGDELQVRDGRVWLETLGGAEPVHVILRRIDDAWCDPLDLRSDSTLGVAGLVDAARRGEVLVANTIGAGLIEHPAIGAHLGQICRRLLGEEPLLETLATGPATRAALTAAPGPWVLRGADHDRMPPAANDHDGWAAIAADLRSNPLAWTAKRIPPRAPLPVLVDDQVAARHVVLRCFALADGDDGWRVLPGGLTRFASGPDQLMVSMQAGAGAKDTWVLEPDARDTAAPQLRTSFQRHADDLPRRVVDNLYWIGRYIERLEHLLRLTRALARGLAQGERGGSPPVIAAALARFGLLPELGPAVIAARPAPRLLAAAIAGTQPGAMPALCETIHRVAGQLRDRLSADAWRVVSRIARPLPGDTGDPGELMVRIEARLGDHAAWAGLVADNMTRSIGWRFLDMGRAIERQTLTATLIGGVADPSRGADASPAARLALEVGDSILTQLWRARAPDGLAALVDVLVLDETNPRAIAFQARRLLDDLDQIAAGWTGVRRPDLSEVRRLAEINHLLLRLADARWNAPPHLATEMTAVMRRGTELSDAIAARFFTPIGRSQQ